MFGEVFEVSNVVQTCKLTLVRKYVIQRLQKSGNDTPRTPLRDLREAPNMGGQSCLAASEKAEVEEYRAMRAYYEVFCLNTLKETSRCEAFMNLTSSSQNSIKITGFGPATGRRAAFLNC